MFNITHSPTPRQREIIAQLDSFEAAKAYARDMMKAYFMEDDADYEGCADFITEGGQIYAIQPEGFLICTAKEV